MNSRALLAALAFASLAIGAQALTVRVVPIAANDLAYDSARGTLWVSVAAISTTYGNQVVPIDPGIGQISPGVPVGTDPVPIDVSEDGSFLYVGHANSPEIHRIELASRSIDLTFSLAPEFLGPTVAEDIEVHPLDPHAVAISRMFLGMSPRHAGIGIYDDGVARSTAAFSVGNRIEFDSSGGFVYGLGNEGSSFEVGKIRVDAAGATEVGTTPYLVFGFGRDMHLSGGQLFGTDGSVIDPPALRREGSFWSDPSSNAVLLDPGIGAVYFADRGGVDIFDRDRFVFRSRVPISGLVGIPMDPVLLGPGRFAFRTTGRQVVIVDLEVPSADADQDRVVDAYDNCVQTANPSQADTDVDGKGDACDPSPADPLDGYAACRTQREAGSASLPPLLAAISQCEAGGYLDADGDDEPDVRDRCVGTAAGQLVDGAGCSQAQFCAALPASLCKRGDFRNDEPGLKRPGDCASISGACGLP